MLFYITNFLLLTLVLIAKGDWGVYTVLTTPFERIGSIYITHYKPDIIINSSINIEALSFGVYMPDAVYNGTHLSTSAPLTEFLAHPDFAGYGVYIDDNLSIVLTYTGFDLIKTPILPKTTQLWNDLGTVPSEYAYTGRCINSMISYTRFWGRTANDMCEWLNNNESVYVVPTNVPWKYAAYTHTYLVWSQMSDAPVMQKHSEWIYQANHFLPQAHVLAKINGYWIDQCGHKYCYPFSTVALITPLTDYLPTVQSAWQMNDTNYKTFTINAFNNLRFRDIGGGTTVITGQSVTQGPIRSVEYYFKDQFLFRVYVDDTPTTTTTTPPTTSTTTIEVRPTTTTTTTTVELRTSTLSTSVPTTTTTTTSTTISTTTTTTTTTTASTLSTTITTTTLTTTIATRSSLLSTTTITTTTSVSYKSPFTSTTVPIDFTDNFYNFTTDYNLSNLTSSATTVFLASTLISQVSAMAYAAPEVLLTVNIVYMGVIVCFLWLFMTIFNYCINHNIVFMSGTRMVALDHTMARALEQGQLNDCETCYEIHTPSCPYSYENQQCICDINFAENIEKFAEGRGIKLENTKESGPRYRIVLHAYGFRSIQFSLLLVFLVKFQMVKAMDFTPIQIATLSITALNLIIMTVATIVLAILVFKKKQITRFSWAGLLIISFCITAIAQTIPAFSMESTLKLVYNIIVCAVSAIFIILMVALIIYTQKNKHNRDTIGVLGAILNKTRLLSTGFFGVIFIALIVAQQVMLASGTLYQQTVSDKVSGLNDKLTTHVYDLDFTMIVNNIIKVDSVLENSRIKSMSTIACPTRDSYTNTITSCSTGYRHIILYLDQENQRITYAFCYTGVCSVNATQIVQLSELKLNYIPKMFYENVGANTPYCSAWNVPVCINTSPQIQNVDFNWGGDFIYTGYSIQITGFTIFLPSHAIYYLQATRYSIRPSAKLFRLLGLFGLFGLKGNKDKLSIKEFERYKAQQDQINKEIVQITKQITDSVGIVDNKLHDFITHTNEMFTNVYNTFTELSTTLATVGRNINALAQQNYASQVGVQYDLQIKHYVNIRQEFFNLITEMENSINANEYISTILPLYDFLQLSTNFFEKKGQKMNFIYSEFQKITNGYRLLLTFSQRAVSSDLLVFSPLLHTADDKYIYGSSDSVYIVTEDDEQFISNERLAPTAECLSACNGLVWRPFPKTKFYQNELLLIQNQRTIVNEVTQPTILGWIILGNQLFISVTNGSKLEMPCEQTFEKFNNVFILLDACPGIYSYANDRIVLKDTTHLSVGYSFVLYGLPQETTDVFYFKPIELIVPNITNFTADKVDLNPLYSQISNLSKLVDELSKTKFGGDDDCGDSFFSFICIIGNFFKKNLAIVMTIIIIFIIVVAVILFCVIKRCVIPNLPQMKAVQAVSTVNDNTGFF